MEKINFQAVLAANPANIYYYTGFHGEDSYLLIGFDNVCIISDGRYAEQINQDAPWAECVLQRSGGNGSWLQIIAGLCERWAVKELSFEADHISCRDYTELKKAAPGLEMSDCGDLLSAGRMIKDEHELCLLQEVAALGDQVMQSIERFFKPGITEKELAKEIDYAFLSLGADGLSFPTIVAAGPNGAKPHAHPSDYQFKAGDFVTIDMGGRLHGYCGDMTRTIAIAYADDEHKAAYELVQNAQATALEKLRPGLRGFEGDAIARNIIAEAGFGEYFVHSLGHSVGLEIHEQPNLSPSDKTILCPGHVVTVEPGIYLPDRFGLRIEDTAVITDKGAEALTHYPKQLLFFK
jgi:Xaa-Pro aminopeptidase